jgi:hypothetical protein
MPHRQGEHHELGVVDLAQNPVVANPVTPKSRERPLQARAPAARISGGDYRVEGLHNAPAHRAVQLAQPG